MHQNSLFEYSNGSSLVFRIRSGIKLLLFIVICITAGFLSLPYILLPLIITAAALGFSGSRVLKDACSLWKLYLFFILTALIKGYTSGCRQTGLTFFIRLLILTEAGLIFYETTRLSSIRRLLQKVIGPGTADIFIMMIAFIPLIFRSIDQQKTARYSRCFKADKRLFRSFRHIALPLLVDMLLKTEEMTDAWYSRGYRVKK